MKHIAKLSFITALAAILGTFAAHADDQQLASRLAAQRAQSPSSVVQTTVAVYAGQRDHGQSVDTIQAERSETRFELRSNAHGQQFGVYTAAH